MKLPTLPTRDWIALMLAVTVCMVLLMSVGRLAFHPPGALPAEGREALQSTVALLIGILSGYIGARPDEPPPP